MYIVFKNHQFFYTNNLVTSIHPTDVLTSKIRKHFPKSDFEKLISD